MGVDVVVVVGAGEGSLELDWNENLRVKAGEGFRGGDIKLEVAVW